MGRQVRCFGLQGPARPAEQLSDELCQSLAQEGLKRRAATEKSATAGPRCGSGLRTHRSRTGAQVTRTARTKSSLWRGSDVPALPRNPARREAEASREGRGLVRPKQAHVRAGRPR